MVLVEFTLVSGWLTKWKPSCQVGTLIELGTIFFAHICSDAGFKIAYAMLLLRCYLDLDSRLSRLSWLQVDLNFFRSKIFWSCHLFKRIHFLGALWTGLNHSEKPYEARERVSQTNPFLAGQIIRPKLSPSIDHRLHCLDIGKWWKEQKGSPAKQCSTGGGAPV